MASSRSEGRRRGGSGGLPLLLLLVTVIGVPTMIADGELFFGYGVRKVILDNSVVEPLKYLRLAPWYQTRGVELGLEGWHVDWRKKTFGGLSWQFASYHMLNVLNHNNPDQSLRVHRQGRVQPLELQPARQLVQVDGHRHWSPLRQRVSKSGWKFSWGSLG